MKKYNVRTTISFQYNGIEAENEEGAKAEGERRTIADLQSDGVNLLILSLPNAVYFEPTTTEEHPTDQTEESATPA